MYCMDYDSVKLTNYVQRFCIIPRVRGGVAEFTLLVQLVNNERAHMQKSLDFGPISPQTYNFLIAICRNL